MIPNLGQVPEMRRSREDSAAPIEHPEILSGFGLRALGMRLPDSRPTPSPFGGKGKRVDCQAHRCTSRRSRKAECRTMSIPPSSTGHAKFNRLLQFRMTTGSVTYQLPTFVERRNWEAGGPTVPASSQGAGLSLDGRVARAHSSGTQRAS